MIARDYLIIGAGPAGASVAEGIRQYDRRGKIMLVGNENHAPYRRPALSKSFLSAKHPVMEELFLFPPAWYEEHKIDLRLGCVVTQFNIDRRLAVLSNGQTVEFNKACLATGCRPLRPQVAGASLGNVIYLRTLNDALALREMAAVEENIVVVGGGWIAVEAAAALRASRHKVTLMARDPLLWQPWLDAATAAWLSEVFRHHGVTLHLNEFLNGFEGKTVLRNVQTKSGTRLPAALALVAVGVDMNLELVRGTPLSSPKGVPVTEYLETDEKGIYAVGDIALFPDKIFGGARRLDHWENARQQGLLAGANMTGKKRQKYDYLPYYDSQLFDLHWRFIGDFTAPPGRTELEGSRDKKHFTVRYFEGDKLRAAVLVNRGEDESEEMKKAIRAAHAGGK